VPRSVIQRVSGRAIREARVLKGVWVSPMEWRRMRMFAGGWGDGDGMIDRVREGGKEDDVGICPGMIEWTEYPSYLDVE